MTSEEDVKNASESDDEDDKGSILNNNEGVISISFSPQQAHIFGGQSLFLSFVNTESPFDKDMLYYVIFQGSNLRHITSTKILNPYTLQAVIPDHDEAELVSLSVCKQTKDGDSSDVEILANDTFVFTSDSSQFLTQELALNALNPLALLQLQHVYSSLLDISAEEKKELDAKLTASFRHLSLPSNWKIAAEERSEAEESHWTLLHFCAQYNLSILANYFLQQRGASIALKYYDKNGHTPYDIAVKKNNKRMVEILTRIPCEDNHEDIVEDIKRPSVKRHRLGTTTITNQAVEKEGIVKDLMLLKELDALATASKGCSISNGGFTNYEEASPLAESLKKLQEINDEIRRLRSLSYKESIDQYENEMEDEIDGDINSTTSTEDNGNRNSFIEISTTESNESDEKSDDRADTSSEQQTSVFEEQSVDGSSQEAQGEPLEKQNEEREEISEIEETNEEYISKNDNDVDAVVVDTVVADEVPAVVHAVLDRRTSNVELQTVVQPVTEVAQILTSSAFETFTPEVAEVFEVSVGEVSTLPDNEVNSQSTDESTTEEEMALLAADLNFKLESVTEETEEELDAAWSGKSPGLRNPKHDGLVSSTQTRSLNDITPPAPKRVGILKRSGAKKDRPLSDSFENLKMVESQGIVGFLSASDSSVTQTKVPLTRGHSLDALTSIDNAGEENETTGSQLSINDNQYSQESISSDDESKKSIYRSDSDRFSIGSSNRASSLISLNDVHMSRCSSTSSQEDLERYLPKRGILSRLSKIKKAKSMSSLDMKSTEKQSDSGDKDDRRKTISGELEAAFISTHTRKKDKLKSEEHKDISENMYGDILVRCEAYDDANLKKSSSTISVDKLGHKENHEKNYEVNDHMLEAMAEKHTIVSKKSVEKKKDNDKKSSSMFNILRSSKPKEKKNSKEKQKEEQRDRRDSDSKTKKPPKVANKPELSQTVQDHKNHKNFLAKRGTSFRQNLKAATELKTSNNTGFTKDSSNKLRTSERRSPIMNRKISSAILETTESTNDNEGGMLSKNLSSSRTSLDSINLTGDDATDYSNTINDPSIDSNGYDSDLDAKDEPETWSELVDKNTKKKMHAKDIKRQDVIYELIQTEALYVRTLNIMRKIYAHGMLNTLQMDGDHVNKIFPLLDDLIELNGNFIKAMKKRQEESPNLCIEDIGDILLDFFGDENGHMLKYVYGYFCSHHMAAVALYKEYLKNDKRFAAYMKRCMVNDRVRRLSIPECITYVTIRMTKYPLLIEAIIKATKENKPDYEKLKSSLRLVKEVLHAVDDAVEVYEQEKELKIIKKSVDRRFVVEVKLESKTSSSHVKYRPTRLFHRNTRLLMDKKITLKGKNKIYDTRMIILNTKVIFFQENGGKLQLLSVDNKAPVLSLKNILVKEVATDNKALFLVSTSKDAAQIYEIAMMSYKEKKDFLPKLQKYIREGTDSDAENNTSDEEEAIKEEQERMARLKEILDQLHTADQKVSNALVEKNKLVSEMRDLIETMDDSGPVKGSSCSDLKATEVTAARETLQACITEVNTLSTTVCAQLAEPTVLNSPLPSPALTNASLNNTAPNVGQKRADTFSGFEQRLKPSHSLSNVNRSVSSISKFGRPSAPLDSYDSSKPRRGPLSVLGRTKTSGSIEDLSTLSSSTSTTSLTSMTSANLQMQLFQSLKDHLSSLVDVTSKQDSEVGRMRLDLQETRYEVGRLSIERKEIDEKMAAVQKDCERQIRNEKEAYQKLHREFKRTVDKLNRQLEEKKSQYNQLLTAYNEQNGGGSHVNNGTANKQQKHTEEVIYF